MLVFSSFPDAPLTQSLVKNAISTQFADIQYVDTPPEVPQDTLLQWSTYDAINHELAAAHPNRVFSSSYTIRKALIRKHFLHRTVKGFTAKNPTSILTRSVPETWDLEIAFPDELDELWADDLYDLAESMDENPTQWWLLKPGMADRGSSIKIFRTKDELAAIFEEMDISDDEEGDNQPALLSQLRHFVIQVCLTVSFFIR
jgi:tubulin---tyrosine ligase